MRTPKTKLIASIRLDLPAPLGPRCGFRKVVGAAYPVRAILGQSFLVKSRSTTKMLLFRQVFSNDHQPWPPFFSVFWSPTHHTGELLERPHTHLPKHHNHRTPAHPGFPRSRPFVRLEILQDHLLDLKGH